MALIAATSGVAVAAIPDSDGTLTACLNKDGQLKVIDAEEGRTCHGSQTTVKLASTDAAGKVANSDKLDGQDSTAFLGAAAKAADADLLDGQDSTAFLGATAKAADADALDGIDSTGFVRGRSGTDLRRVITTNSLSARGTPAPFGNVDVFCDTFAGRATFGYTKRTGPPVDVWQQVNAGAPSFRTLSGDASTGEQHAVAPTRYTLELSDGTDSGEIDIWMRYSDGSCKFILHTTSGNSP